jgi:REP element-mobilizing transposase RayT
MYVHCVWATWDRLPIITSDIQKIVYATLIKECEQLGCIVIAIGGIEDHVHLLIGFPPTITISNLMKQIKGSSSHFINHEIKPNQFFKWQGSYAAFTVSHESIDTVANYIRNQKDRHRQKSLIPTWELKTDL